MRKEATVNFTRAPRLTRPRLAILSLITDPGTVTRVIIDAAHAP